MRVLLVYSHSSADISLTTIKIWIPYNLNKTILLSGHVCKKLLNWWRTLKILTRRCIMRRLIRVYIVCPGLFVWITRVNLAELFLMMRYKITNGWGNHLLSKFLVHWDERIITLPDAFTVEIVLDQRKWIFWHTRLVFTQRERPAQTV